MYAVNWALASPNIATTLVSLHFCRVGNGSASTFITIALVSLCCDDGGSVTLALGCNGLSSWLFWGHTHGDNEGNQRGPALDLTTARKQCTCTVKPLPSCSDSNSPVKRLDNSALCYFFSIHTSTAGFRYMELPRMYVPGIGSVFIMFFLLNNHTVHLF